VKQVLPDIKHIIRTDMNVKLHSWMLFTR